MAPGWFSAGARGQQFIFSGQTLVGSRTVANMKNQRGIVLAACVFALLSLMSSCGGEGGPTSFYSVNVINGTDSTITVRYDWEELFWVYQWIGKDTVLPGGSKIIEWSSANWSSEQIEVEYQGKKKLYTVSQLGTVQVSVQDFL